MKPKTSPREQEFLRRIYIFSAAAVFFFLVFIGVLFSLQIIRGSQYAQKAKKNREQYSILPAIRGVIYDRDGDDILAYNRRSFAINIVPQNLPKDPEELSGMLEKLAVLLRMDVGEIRETISKKQFAKFGTLVLKTNVPFRDIAYLAEHNRDFPGVYWKSKPLRVYPYNDMLCHVLGYVGMISESEYLETGNEGYNIESVIGKSGIEKIYDSELKGRDGYVRRIVDATNQVTAEIIDKGAEPLPGDNVVLTIDARLQRIVEESLGERNGAVVVSKPATGEILAMASYPRFNPNLFSAQTDKDTFKKLALDPGKPFLNRVIQAQYPAGSIFKLVVAVAGLDTGKINPDTVFPCRGGYQLGNRWFSCWTNHGLHVDLYKAISQSCDAYFYQAALLLGHRTIAAYAHRLGLGKKTGIDLIGEMAGIIPDEEWKLANKGEMWYDGDTLNMSIGQGFVLVTPLQLNMLTNIIVNRGVLMKPFVVKEIYSAKTNDLVYRRTPEVLLRSEIEASHFDFVMKAMRGVVAEGTARWGGTVYSVDAAGKTSTSQVMGEEEHSWYSAFAPFGSTDPDEYITVTAIVEHGGAGSATAAPIVADIMEAYFSGLELQEARENNRRRRVAKYRERKSEQEQ